jgi:hypothetical protein
MNKLKLKLLKKINLNMNKKYSKIYLYFLKIKLENFYTSNYNFLEFYLDNDFDELFKYSINTYSKKDLFKLLNCVNLNIFCEKIIKKEDLYLNFINKLPSDKLNYIFFDMIKKGNKNVLKIKSIKSTMQSKLMIELTSNNLENEEEVTFFKYIMNNLDIDVLNVSYYKIICTHPQTNIKDINKKIKKIKILLDSNMVNEINFKYWLNEALVYNISLLYKFYKNNIIIRNKITEDVFISMLENKIKEIKNNNHKFKLTEENILFHECIKKDLHRMKINKKLSFFK